MNENPLLQKLKVKDADRKYQVWERNSLSIEVFSQKIFNQKLEYIHNNPIQEKWKLSPTQQEYKYSSALFYETGEDEFEILEKHNE